MNLIRCVLLFPFYTIKYMIVFTHYVVDLGFCFSLFDIELTYKSFEDVIDDIDNGYCFPLLFVILPGFFLAIPAFIIRHIYFIWLFVQEKYNELNWRIDKNEWFS